MNEQAAMLKSTISEYIPTVNSVCSKSVVKVNNVQLARALCKDHDWTDRGAHALVTLANEYGAFMLRNALALAVALDKEDGALEF